MSEEGTWLDRIGVGAGDDSAEDEVDRVEAGAATAAFLTALRTARGGNFDQSSFLRFR